MIDDDDDDDGFYDSTAACHRPWPANLVDSVSH